MRTLTIRPLTDEDEPQVLGLLSTALGWAGGEHRTRLYRWKHVDNPFGRSFGWVATDSGRLVGVRLFMRWRFRQNGELVNAVRAVDTATHMDYRGRGVFSSLTRHGLDALAEAGVAFVFNTPNDQSRPGYLKLGWEPVGHLPLALHLRSVTVLPRTARARVPAALESLPTSAGLPACEGLDGLASCAPVGSLPGQLMTDRTGEFLRWRYSLPQLRYRTVRLGSGGAAVFRLRRRGAAVELVVNDVLVSPGTAASEIARAVRRLLHASGADHAIRIAPTHRRGQRLPISGPTLFWRAVTTPSPAPQLGQWALSMGDVELF
ncbi:MAG: GNAT family N-acetyltransferase [Egibacteraceae bacterium]